MSAAQREPVHLSSQLLTIEILNSLLESTASDQLSERLTAQLRELTGAATVLLIRGHEHHKVIGASPQRRADLLNTATLDSLCPACNPGPTALLSDSMELPQEIRLALGKATITNLLRFPLVAAGEKIGSMLLADIPEAERYEEVCSTVAPLLPSIAMCLRNTISREQIENQSLSLRMMTSNLELRVAERTADLQLEIQERARIQDDLAKALEQKETLLRELYHRTKNTLQMVISMLSLQAQEFPDSKEVQKIVQNTTDRVLAISLVHQKLYQGHDLSRISMRDYLNDLIDLQLSGSILQGLVSKELDIAPLEFTIDSAVPFGLILTELVTNSLKHAFSPDRQNVIIVKLHQLPSGSLLLEYHDNGAGLPAGFDPAKAQSLGMRLINTIAKSQLGATVGMESQNGFWCRIEFPPPDQDVRV